MLSCSRDSVNDLVLTVHFVLEDHTYAADLVYLVVRYLLSRFVD